ncbi:lanthionine synthetase C family protein [Spirosoma areae]
MNNVLIDSQTSVETLLHRIYEHITEQPVTEVVSLMGGQTGYALFESYYHRQFGIIDTNRVWERLGSGIDAIGTGKVDHTFAGGIAGIAWGFLHLANNGFLHDSTDDPQEIIAALDEPLFLLSMEDLSTGNFDYLHGGLGACLYFLERRPTPEIDAYLTQIIAQLATIAVEKNNGEVTWLFPNFGERKPEDPADYNLSLSHGTASIVAILCLLYKRGYAKAQCVRLIEGALRWMWNSRNKEGIAVFPNRVTDESQDEYSRLAWCYGDLGIANTYWRAGEILRSDRWRQIAEYTIVKAAPRRSRMETLISDAGLCHGSAGAAYLFSQFANRYQASILEQASHQWLGDTVSRVWPQEEKDVSIHLDSSETHRSDLGLLEGEAGVGMMLLTRLGASSSWERAFLLG